MIQTAILEAYVDRIYAFAVRKTYTREEADELSQEILFTAVKELHKLRDEGCFEPWLWGVARNVERSFRRKMGRQRAMYSYNVPEDISCDGAAEEELARSEELYAMLRAKIAMLSSAYRDIIILHYYDGLSTRQIADRLGLPEGTVTWRLSEARKKLKKECSNMEESALRPVKMRIDIYGNGNYDGVQIPFPNVYIEDALSQNILYYCYAKPRGIEELAKLCGVPAYYVEERMENLVRHEAVTESAKGKYRTEFLIWTDEYGKYWQENAANCLMPVMDKMLAAFHGIAEEAGRIDFYKAEKSEAELFYLYGVMAVMEAERKYSSLPYPEIREKYDGYAWEYIGTMETGAYRRNSVGNQLCKNMGSGGNYCQWVYCFTGFSWKKMMYDIYINICQDILEKGYTENEYYAGEAIREGYIRRREDGSLHVLTPAFTREQKEEFDRIADRHLAPVMEEYCQAIDRYLTGYRRLFPEHLGDTADRMCRSVFQGMYDVIVSYAQDKGELPVPPEGSVCDVLLQKKE